METPNELTDAFAAAVPFALREMAGVEAAPRAAESAADSPAADISAIINLSAVSAEWRLLMVFPGPTAAALARRVLAGAAVELTPEMVRDCMGEVANVVAGQAKSLLAGGPFHFTLSTPTVLTGGPQPAGVGRVLVFDSDAGEFAVWVYPARGGRGESVPQREGSR